MCAHARRLTPDLVRRLALAVARPGGQAMLLKEDNTGGPWVPVEQALAGGHPFAVELIDDVLACDADNPDQAAEAERLARDLSEAGFRPVLLESGQPGRRHVFCWIDDPDLRKAWATKAREAGLGLRSAIRPP